MSCLQAKGGDWFRKVLVHWNFVVGQKRLSFDVKSILESQIEIRVETELS